MDEDYAVNAQKYECCDTMDEMLVDVYKVMIEKREYQMVRVEQAEELVKKIVNTEKKAHSEKLQECINESFVECENEFIFNERLFFKKISKLKKDLEKETQQL